MIRNKKEYKEAVARLRAEAGRLQEQAEHLRSMGLEADQVTRALDPFRSFHLQLQEEVASYERLRRGTIDEVRKLRGLGRVFAGLRIALGLSQKDLAEKLGVHPSQVSRDERNEYHGVTVERAGRILDALGVELTTGLAGPLPLPAPGDEKSAA